MGKKSIYIELCADGAHVRADNGVNGGGGFLRIFRELFAPKVVLIANTPQTIIRAEKLNDGKQKLTPEAKWGLVKKAFPLGRAVNEESHLFDGCVYSAKERDAVFLMAALPLETTDDITRLGTEQAGGKRIVRLDTIENMIFRRFCNGDTSQPPQWVIIPQGVGYRVLAMAQGVPKDAHYLPVQPEIREGALLRIYEADAPEEVILLTRSDWEGFWDDHAGWIKGFAGEQGIKVKMDGFNYH
ncbi:MAG: hypothetical protein FWD90_11150 [Defluviitaleaceae bacterium]|nr:hypothetical protein [Defluviitaleaceae bacterium]